jgi:hypothetical protein
MDPRDVSTPKDMSMAGKADLHQDVQSLWERWDEAQKEKTSSELVKGYNLLGVVMFIVGALFQGLGSGFLKLNVGPILILVGVAILAVKKFRALWSQRSLNS